jgi:predicted RNA-binding Zn-ribbon protein involved in translation (DUF1610 family)
MDYQKFLCPICGENMPQYHDENEDDASTGVNYDKTVYRCKNDDVWVTIEVPIPDEPQK